MKPGDILRQRKVRTYFTSSETRGYVEYVADQERIKVNQKVFVSLLLGMEPLGYDKPLDEEKALNALGLWNETQLEDVLGVKETQKLLRKLHQFALGKREKAQKERACSKDS